jgi:hypothetical protein
MEINHIWDWVTYAPSSAAFSKGTQINYSEYVFSPDLRLMQIEIDLVSIKAKVDNEIVELKRQIAELLREKNETKCECGVDTVGGTHSNYCPKH